MTLNVNLLLYRQCYAYRDQTAEARITITITITMRYLYSAPYNNGQWR